MRYADIRSALDALTRKAYELEAIYTENGGEITPDTEALEEQRAALADLLAGEGVDTLGRWLKAKEDERAMYKAEKAAADRRIKSVDKTIDFIKEAVGDILRATGREKVKGMFYTFAQFTGTKTGYDAQALDARYLDAARAAAHAAGLPESIDVALKTSTTRLLTSEDTAAFVQTEYNPTSMFVKPRRDGEDS